MTDLNTTLASALSSRYRKLASVVRELAGQVSDEQFWAKPFAFGNSFGHLVLHLTGNLNYYIGAQMAGTGYVRDRPLEFSETARPLKADVLRKFDQAIEVVLKTIHEQTAENWCRDYAAERSDAHDRFEMMLTCVTHLDHHVGQMMYLVFELKQRTI